MARLRNDGSVFKMKTFMTLSTYKNKIVTITNDREALSEQCAIMEEQIAKLRDQNMLRQLEILALESGTNGGKQEDCKRSVNELSDWSLNTS